MCGGGRQELWDSEWGVMMLPCGVCSDGRCWIYIFTNQFKRCNVMIMDACVMFQEAAEEDESGSEDGGKEWIDVLSSGTIQKTHHPQPKVGLLHSIFESTSADAHSSGSGSGLGIGSGSGDGVAAAHDHSLSPPRLQRGFQKRNAVAAMSVDRSVGLSLAGDENGNDNEDQDASAVDGAPSETQWGVLSSRPKAKAKDPNRRSVAGGDAGWGGSSRRQSLTRAGRHKSVHYSNLGDAALHLRANPRKRPSIAQALSQRQKMQEPLQSLLEVGFRFCLFVVSLSLLFFSRLG